MTQTWRNILHNYTGRMMLEDLLIGALAIIVFVLIYVPAKIARILDNLIDKCWAKRGERR